MEDSKSAGNTNSDGTVDPQSAITEVHDGTYAVVYESAQVDKLSGGIQNTTGYDTAQTSNVALYTDINGTAVPDYPAAGAVENGEAPNAVSGAPVEQTYGNDTYSAEEDRLWNAVRLNCLDFDSWTALIEETEKVAESNILKIRKVYDAFLAEFPLCFGYWKKYADHEGRLDSVQKVVEVYERAVISVTYSVDIWVNYCMFAIQTYENPDIIRRLFERGLTYVGTDYRSDLLWDEYIRYEESQQAWSNLAMIYTRILEHPIQQIDRYYNGFRHLTTTQQFSQICTPEEAALLAASVEMSSQASEAHPEGEHHSPKPTDASSSETEQLEKYISIRDDMYKKAKEYESKIIGFETAIRRPYFHVRPLDRPELENWHNYLDFVEREDDFNKVIKLYERCVIACANYTEFWIRYVLCMEASGSLELAGNVLARATQVFVKKQPEMHLFDARFKELNGDISGARKDYEYLYSELFPGCLEAIIKHANMEHRLGQKESALAVYDKAIAVEQQKAHSQILPMLLIQYSRFLYLVVGDTEKGRETLEKLTPELHMSKPVIEAIIHFESITPSEKRIGILDSLVENFITPDPNNCSSTVSTSDREEISSIYLEFLDLFGDANSIKKAHNRHAVLFQRQKSITVSRKRSADDSLASDRDKIARTGDAGQAISAAYPNTPTSNGQKTPPWPATSQAPAQQWSSSGYATQAGYAAYGAYANYPQSVPQSATAYGAYPSAYTTPAYPQQSYAQPAAAAAAGAAAAPAAAFPQQPATAQAYYGTYY